MQQTDILIIGAGPYGLSLSAFLKAMGVSHVIIGDPMGTWRNAMPPEMLLKSEIFASSLASPDRKYTVEAFLQQERCQPEPGSPLPLAIFLKYADWFTRNAVGRIMPTRVGRLEKNGDRFVATLDTGDAISSSKVVVATGLVDFQRLPAALRGMGRTSASHSIDHSDLEKFRGMDVTVIGAGQSAIGTAAILHEHGAKPRLLARKDTIIWNAAPQLPKRWLDRVRAPESGLCAGWRCLFLSEFPRLFRWLPLAIRLRLVRNSMGPSASWWLRDRAIGKFPIETGHEVVSATEGAGKVTLLIATAGGVKRIETDHVVAATGFEPDLDRIPFLDPSLRSHIATQFGYPVLSRSFESSVPGLYFVGVTSALTFGPVMRFIFGAKHAAKIVARHLTGKRVQGTTAPAAIGAKAATSFPPR